MKQIIESRLRAVRALNEYKAAGGIDPEYAIRDLMSDLMHLMNETMPISDVEFEHMMALNNFLSDIEDNGAQE